MSEAQFWMVWNPDNRPPMHRHASGGEAVREAERLAALHPGQRFYVVKALRYAQIVKPTVMVELQPPMPEPPF